MVELFCKYIDAFQYIEQSNNSKKKKKRIQLFPIWIWSKPETLCHSLSIQEVRGTILSKKTSSSTLSRNDEYAMYPCCVGPLLNLCLTVITMGFSLGMLIHMIIDVVVINKYYWTSKFTKKTNWIELYILPNLKCTQWNSLKRECSNSLNILSLFFLRFPTHFPTHSNTTINFPFLWIMYVSVRCYVSYFPFEKCRQTLTQIILVYISTISLKVVCSCCWNFPFHEKLIDFNFFFSK